MIDIKKQWKTRDGRKVRLYCDDGEGFHPIHGAILSEEDKLWKMSSWSKDGYLVSLLQCSLSDLMPIVRKDALGYELPEDCPDLPEGDWVYRPLLEGEYKFDSDWMSSANGSPWRRQEFQGEFHHYIQKLHRPDGSRIDEAAKKTTGEEWFREGLPKDIAELAIANIDKGFHTEVTASLEKSLLRTFTWSSSKEGTDFWKDVYRAVIGKKDFPAIPQKKYWSKPSDLPEGPIWICREGSLRWMLVNVVSPEFFIAEGFPLRWGERKIKDFRWASDARGTWAEAKECVCEE